MFANTNLSNLNLVFPTASSLFVQLVEVVAASLSFSVTELLDSSIMVSNTSASNLAIAGTTITDTCIVCHNVSVQGGANLTGLFVNTTILFIDTSLTSTFSFEGGGLDSSLITFQTVSIATRSLNAMYLSSFPLAAGSSFEVLNSTLTTTGNYAMYLSNTNISDGSRLVFEDTTLNATNALYMSGYQLNSGGVLYMRRTTMMAASAPYYTMYVQGSGGQIDHDGSNRHSKGSISIMFNAPSSDNFFVLNHSAVNTVVFLQTSSVDNCTMAVLDSKPYSLSVTSSGPTSYFNMRIERSTLYSTTWRSYETTNTTIAASNVTGANWYLCGTGTTRDTTVMVLDSAFTSTYLTSLSDAQSGTYVVANRSTLAYSGLLGSMSGHAAYIVDQTTMSSTNANTLLINAVYTDALLEVRRSVVTSTNSFAVYVRAQIYGGSVHRFVGSTLESTYTTTVSYATPPGQGALCYSTTARFNDNSVLVADSNNMSVALTGAFGLFGTNKLPEDGSLNMIKIPPVEWRLLPSWSICPPLPCTYIV